MGGNVEEEFQWGSALESSENDQTFGLEPASGLVLDSSERRLLGIEMPPLLTGEFRLLSFLGGSPRRWFSTYALSTRVYGRDDASARQLVWKYASTLRKKLANERPGLIELCRRRGYSCREAVTIVSQ